MKLLTESICYVMLTELFNNITVLSLQSINRKNTGYSRMYNWVLSDGQKIF